MKLQTLVGRQFMGPRIIGRIVLAVAGLLGAGCAAMAAGPSGDDPQNVLAAQLRDQGYACNQPQSAERDVQASTPDEAVWIVQCENDKYRVRLVPDMAAKVERLD
jgi:hypothetical protein